MDTKAAIWKTLRAVKSDGLQTTTEVITNKDGSTTTLTYVHWMDAHIKMMELYPDYEWRFSEDEQRREAHYFNDGTAEVRCHMTIQGHTQITSLPIQKFGDTILAPDCSDVNTAKQRCRVKAMAEFGLFADMYSKVEQSSKPVVIREPGETPEPDCPKPTGKESTAIDIYRQWSANKKEAFTKAQAEAEWQKYETKLKNLGLTDSGLADRKSKYFKENAFYA